MSPGILVDTELYRIADEVYRIVDEAQACHAKYGQPTSTHESLGVLLEEFDELKYAIQANSPADIEMEAIQVAAVAYRLALAVANKDRTFMERSGLKT